MNTDHRTKIIAGWVSLLTAMLISLAATAEVVFTTRTGAPTLTLGLVGSLLGFTAACFGISSYDRAVGNKLEIAKLGGAVQVSSPSSPPQKP